MILHTLNLERATLVWECTECDKVIYQPLSLLAEHGTFVCPECAVSMRLDALYVDEAGGDAR